MADGYADDAGVTAEAAPPTLAPTKRKRSAKETRALLKRARDCHKQWVDSDEEQLTRELEDIKFYDGDQWPEDIRKARKGLPDGNADGLPPIPARPCITINKTREPVRTVLNQERGSDIAIEIVPADDFGDLTGPVDETEIKLREGLTRRIQRESQAADARTWAFSRATIAGRGYYGVMTRRVPGKTRDQEIYVIRYYDQSSVGLDPAHEQPDGSDAEWAIVRTWVPWRRYTAEYGKRNGKDNRIASFGDSDWESLGAEQPDWFKGEKGDDDTRAVLVIDFWYTERESRTVCALADGSDAWKDELPDGFDADQIVDEWEDIQKSIQWCKIDGCDDDVLEETDWPGPDMPIVKVLGEELHPYDTERRAEGMVRTMREPGQGFNAMVSKLVELVALTPVEPPLIEEGTIEGYEPWWKAAGTRALPYLYYRKKNLDGDRTDSIPTALQRNPPIGPVTMGMQMFDDALQDVSVSDPARGQTDSTVKSAKHAGLLQQQASQSTSNYMDNLKRSMRYEGQIINNLLYPIYGTRPGRIARIVNGQGEAETLMVGQPMVSQGGRPMPAPEGAPNAKTYALTPDAKFNVGIKISSSREFRREQEAETVGGLIAAAPQLMSVLGDLYLKNLDGPGHDEMADRMKVMLDPKILAMLDAKKQGQEPPSPQLQQAQQQVQQLTQVAQQLQQQLQAETVKEQAETQRNDAKLRAEVEKARIQAETDKAIEAMKQRTALTIEEWKLRGVQMQTELDAVEADRDRRSQAQAQSGQQAHEAGLAAMGQVAADDAQTAEQSHAAQMQQEQQAASERQAAMAAQQQGPPQ